MTLCTLLSALPMGDDTPVMLYAIIGIAAVALCIAAIVLGKKSKK